MSATKKKSEELEQMVPKEELDLDQAPGSGYTPYQLKRREKEKSAIAKYIVNDIIEDGMSVFLDAGSTIYHVGLELFTSDNKKSGLTIMTNNMLVFRAFTGLSAEMSELGNVLALTGGVYNRNHEALFGQAAEEVLRSFFPKLVLIGASGFVVGEVFVGHPTHPRGAFHHDLVSEVVTKKAIVAMPTSHRVIVCDYSKIGVWDASCFATIEELAQNTERCTIVTSVVPDISGSVDREQKKLYESRYRQAYEALKKWSLDRRAQGKVEIARVDYDGKKESG